MALMAAGFIALGLGFAGIFLPLLPTTPFILLAAFLFDRSSPRFHAWLFHHPRFGAILRDWRENRAISMRGKVMATVAMAVAIAIPLIAGFAPWIIAVQVAVMAGVLTFIWTRNTT